MRVLKYTLVLVIPALFVLGCLKGNWLVLSPFLFAFVFIPALELIFKPDQKNLEQAQTEILREDKVYDWLLYAVAPIVYGMVVLFLFTIKTQNLSLAEISGLTLSLAVILGGMGINVAHELGHRANKKEQFLAKALLLPSFYMHFFIEHNRGHHKNVSTLDDPASSRRNESLYAFWIRSTLNSYRSAWGLESQRLKRAKISEWTWKNEMVQYVIIQLAFWVTIFLFFGWKITLCYTIAAIGGFLLLETVNYIEHYGLLRNKISEFRYERVMPAHSWNSNHVVGRLVLFELSRHSDHHYDPTKKYQTLNHHAESPQMPTGYPGMMLLSLIPPLWFAIMNPRIDSNVSNSKRVELSLNSQ